MAPPDGSPSVAQLLPAALPVGDGSTRITCIDAGALPCRAEERHLTPDTQERLQPRPIELHRARQRPSDGSHARGALSTRFGLIIPRVSLDRLGLAWPSPSRHTSRLPPPLPADRVRSRHPCGRRHNFAHRPGRWYRAKRASTPTYRVQPAPGEGTDRPAARTRRGHGTPRRRKTEPPPSPPPASPSVGLHCRWLVRMRAAVLRLFTEAGCACPRPGSGRKMGALGNRKGLWENGLCWFSVRRAGAFALPGEPRPGGGTAEWGTPTSPQSRLGAPACGATGGTSLSSSLRGLSVLLGPDSRSPRSVKKIKCRSPLRH